MTSLHAKISLRNESEKTFNYPVTDGDMSIGDRREHFQTLNKNIMKLQGACNSYLTTAVEKEKSNEQPAGDQAGDSQESGEEEDEEDNDDEEPEPKKRKA